MERGSLPRFVRHLRNVVGRQVVLAKDDADLIDRFVTQRDEAAFELLVWRHERMVRCVCRRVLDQDQDVDDACQATFLTLACKAGTIGRRQALGGWLCRVAYRIALRARADAMRRGRHEKEAGGHRAAQTLAEPAHEESRRDLRRVVEEEVSRLPEKYRTPVLLCYLEGKTNEEAARQLGCPTGTVVTWLARARQRLRARLARRGVGVSAGTLAAILSAPDDAAATSPAFLKQTVQAALAFARDRTAAGLVSARVALLTRGSLHAMFMNKLKLAAVVALAVCLTGTGSAVLAYRALTGDAPARIPDAGPPQVAGREAPEQVAAALPKPPAPVPDDEEKTEQKADKPREKERKERERKDSRQKVEEVVTKAFKTGRSPTLIVEVFNGGVEVIADADGEVNARVVKTGHGDTKEQAEAGLKNVEVTMEQDKDAVRIAARRLEEKQDQPHQEGVSTAVHVPPGAILKLKTSNGGVKLTGGTGKVQVATSNGGIQAKDCKGHLHLTTGNGPIVVSGATGPVELTTTNGAINLQAENAVVTAHTSNSPIRFQGSLADGKHAFTTSNGPIALTLPAEAKFRASAMTSHGSVVNEFAPGSGGPSGGSVVAQAVVGDSPAVALTLQTSNGPITIRKKK